MEQEFNIPPSRIAAHPELYNRIAIGFIDGSIGFYKFNVSKNMLKIVGAKKLKRAVRHIEFSLTGEHLYSISSNKALCVYDVQSNKRIRCIRKSHNNKPNALCKLPSSSTKGQQIATGDESGQIRTWDMRVSNPEISTFDDLKDIVNHLEVNGNTLLGACSDGTLGAYELRQRKLIVRSEPMSSELLSIAPSKSFTYVGNGDGHIEVFKRDEYGNILERIETPHSMGVDCVRLLREDLLISSSNESSDLRLVHVNPNKCMSSIGTHEGGVQQFVLTNDRFWLISVGWLKSTIKFWNVPHILDKIPIIRANNLSKLDEKSMRPWNNFFADLLDEKDDEGQSGGETNDSDEDGQSSDDESMEEYESLDEKRSQKVVMGKRKEEMDRMGKDSDESNEDEISESEDETESESDSSSDENGKVTEITTNENVSETDSTRHVRFDRKSRTKKMKFN